MKDMALGQWLIISESISQTNISNNNASLAFVIRKIITPIDYKMSWANDNYDNKYLHSCELRNGERHYKTKMERGKRAIKRQAI